ncbi:MAG: chemotaxis protein CheA [Candidatus Firestonebacteria bacterium]
MNTDLSAYKDAFLAEGTDLLTSLNQNLLRLEKDQKNKELINELFRIIHTIKGMSATMGFEKVTKLSHELENMLDKIRRDLSLLTPDIIELLFEGTTRFENLFDEIRTEVKPDAKKQDLQGHKLETVRINVNLLDKLVNLTGELVIGNARLKNLASNYHNDELSRFLDGFNRTITDLQNMVLSARIVPVDNTFNRFPKMIRDLAREQEKEINFILEGKDIGLDRVILEEINEPLVHLLRNSVSHGIEKPEERIQKSKNRVGNIFLSAKRERGYVVISVKDDGKGIEPKNIINTAVKLKFITQEEALKLSPREAIMLIAKPGFSTTDSTTLVSGRGVGMDVVKTRIEACGGTVSIESEPGKGSTFILRLPLTLAIIQALLVTVEKEIYAIPLLSVKETLITNKHHISPDEKFVNVNSENLPLINLYKILDLPENGHKKSEECKIVIIEIANKKIGLAVSSFLSQQQIVIKPLGFLGKKIKEFAGATILGTGKVALVLDINALVN